MGALAGDWQPIGLLISSLVGCISLLVGTLVWTVRRIVRGDLIPAATVERITQDLRILQAATERNASAREQGEAELRSQNAQLLQQARLWDAFLRTADANNSGSGHVAQTAQD